MLGKSVFPQMLNYVEKIHLWGVKRFGVCVLYVALIEMCVCFPTSLIISIYVFDVGSVNIGERQSFFYWVLVYDCIFTLYDAVIKILLNTLQDL